MLKDMTNFNNSAIVVAAGSGSRLTSKKPKQFLTLRGVEVLAYSVQTFLAHPSIDEVIIVTSNEYYEHVTNQYPDCKVVIGGKTRQDSVGNGLKACKSSAEHVLVHDAARPLIPAQIIDKCLNALKDAHGVAPAILPVDSMIELKGQGFRNLHRDDLRIIQTPQCFHIDVLRNAHASGNSDTDEIGLVRQSNPQAKLVFVEGATETMKITRPSDLDIIGIYLQGSVD